VQAHVPNFIPNTAVIIESSYAFRQAVDKLLAILREIDDDDDDYYYYYGGDDSSANFIYQSA
jgi:hypothetical protein